MHKKLITACLALVAFAAMAVVPALASASPVLTSGGVKIPANTSIVVTNTSGAIAKFKSNLGTVECSKVNLVANVVENSGTSIKAQVESNEANQKGFTGTAAGGACTSTWGINWTVTTKPPYCVVSTGNDTGSIKNGVCGKESGGPRFILEGPTTCEYERQTSGVGAAITGTYGTNETPVHLTNEAEQNFKLISGSVLAGCPSEGKLEAVFILQTTNGEGITIS